MDGLNQPSDHRHLPAHLVDRFLAGLADESESAAVEGAAPVCDVCRANLEEARRARDAFLARNPPERRAPDLLAEHRTPRRSRRLFWALPALAAAAGAGMLLIVRTPVLPTDSRPPELAKGDAPAIGFSVRRVGTQQARTGSDGETLAAGDIVHLNLFPGAFARAYVFALDARGRSQRLFTWQRLPNRVQPPTLTLDESLETERIFAVFHQGELDPTPIEEAATRALAAGASIEDAQRLVAAPSKDVVIRSILIHKRAP